MNDWVGGAALAGLFIVVMLATGCTSPPKLPEVVKVPVPVTCVRPDELPAAPTVATDAQLAVMDDYDLVLTIAADREELLAAWIHAAALLKACTILPGGV